MPASESSETCTVCLQPLSETDEALECGHRFHHRCALEWFRSGNDRCPLCRAPPRRLLSHPSVMIRFSFLRRKSRSKRAPVSLKRAVEKICTYEAAQRKAAAELREWRRRPEVKSALATLHRRQSAARRTRRAVLRTKRMVGLCEYPGLEMPLISTPDWRCR